MKNYWMCIVGPTERKDLPDGADSPMRKAVKKAFYDTAGHDPEHNWSGWGMDKETKDRVMKAWNSDPEDLDVSLQNVRAKGAQSSYYKATGINYVARYGLKEA